ncbi:MULTISPECIES: MFS transporter [Halomonadaceae]|uniref:MFS transporter n=1 Tax=Halomonas casei TaxID=2742613 RepID=A0ABR9F4G1_9GAMM|nr:MULTISPECIES: MFS transporter [Halomonas]MBE0401371.1 MFS transporter [Halomonas casei]WKD30466.1 MFS transporter [Halomonas sp. KG2]
MSNEASHTQASKSTATILLCLFLTVMMDQAGVVLIAPLIPALLESITGDTLAHNTEIAGWLVGTYGLMQFLFAPIMGSLSDRFGRRRVLLVCFAIFVLDYLIFAIADSIWVLFLGRVIAGITGSSLVVSMASIADISEKHNKTRNFAYMYGAIGLGMIVGPAISSVTVGYGLRVPFLVAALMCAFCFFFILFGFREPLSDASRRPFKIANPMNSINKFRKYPGMSWLFLTHFCILLAFQAPLVLWAFFTKYRFSWNEQQIANSLVLIGVLMVLVQTVVVDFAYKKLGNRKSCFVGYAMFGTGMLLIAVSVHPWFFYLALIPYTLGSVSNAAINSIYSNAVLPSEQGEIQGALVSIASVANAIGPIVVSYLYSVGVQSTWTYGDALPFIGASLLTALSGCFFYRGSSTLVRSKS